MRSIAQGVGVLVLLLGVMTHDRQITSFAGLIVDLMQGAMEYMMQPASGWFTLGCYAVAAAIIAAAVFAPSRRATPEQGDGR